MTGMWCSALSCPRAKRFEYRLEWDATTASGCHERHTAMKRPNLKVEADGQPQTWMGVNFWSRAGGPLMWRHYDGDVVSQELDQMREHGMTVTRSFLYWPDFHPEPDRLDETMLERYRDFLDRHQALGMQTIPTFLVGHMSGQNWDPVWRDGRDLFDDVWFVARQAWYVREITARFKDHPAIAGWLLTNEVPIYGAWRSRGNNDLDPDVIISWSQILIDAVRAGGGTQPVSVGEGAWGVEITGRDNGFRVRDIAALVDFLGPHVYRMETDQSRQFLGAAPVLLPHPVHAGIGKRQAVRRAHQDYRVREPDLREPRRGNRNERGMRPHDREAARVRRLADMHEFEARLAIWPERRAYECHRQCRSIE